MLRKSRIPIQKKWLSLPEAMAYMDMSKNTFLKATTGLTISVVGKKHYYKLAELDALIEDNIILKQTA